MRAWRNTIAASVTAAGLAVAAPGAAQTQPKYPTKPVRILVGFSPGSATDITARMIAPKLAELWGQTVVVDNRSGAGSTLASALVAKANPDGHTLLLISAAFAITAVVQKNLPYDALRDFSGITQIGASTSALAVAPSVGVTSVKALIALAQERPDRIFFGSAGTGSGIHMTTERFNLLAGIRVVHVPFRGQPEMLVDMLAGRIHYGIPGLGPALPFIRDGRLLALAVINQKRSPLLPNVPTMVEVLPGFERDAAHGLVAPARTPRPVVNKIAEDVARVLDSPDVRERMRAIAFEPAPTTPELYDRIIRNQMEIFAKVAKAAGLIAN
jgi:tripartite-type tricarboxylate transporter receptor subunit TctC